MAIKWAVPLRVKALAMLTTSALGGIPVPTKESTSPPIWQPYPGGPQELAIESEADITGYGGSAGGGKTDWLLGLALTRHRNSIIFRREYPQLRGMIQRSREIVGGRGRFNKNESTWTLGDGRVVEFGAVQYESDREKYRGRPHDGLFFDETTEFTPTIIRFLMGWLRTTVPGQRCRVAMTFNPPTHPRQRWIIGFFGPWLDRKHANPALPGELRWFVTDGDEDIEVAGPEPYEVDGRMLLPMSRTFFPARLKDNPILAATGYERTLMALPEPLRSQLLRGDFDADTVDDPWLVLPTAWVEAAMRRWLERGGDEHKPRLPQTGMGMDVAHGGSDQTVLARRHGDWFPRLLCYPGKETPDGKSAAALAARAHEHRAYINVDAIGYGAAAAEKLADSKESGGLGLWAIAINVSEGSEFSDRSGRYGMRNVRAEMYWRLREALDPDGDATLCLPPDPLMLADLTAPTYEITPGGIKIESKDDIRERLKRSPDRGDAVALAMLEPPPAAIARVGGKDQHGRSALAPQVARSPQPDVGPQSPRLPGPRPWPPSR